MKKFYSVVGYEEAKKFGFSQKNRKVNLKHVNDFVNILKDATFELDENGNALAYGIIPVIVNPIFNHILDGQHKISAFVRAIEEGLIPYDTKILVGWWEIYDEEREIYVIIMLNSNSRNWQLEDYLDCYAKEKENYAVLKKFCDKHALCLETNKNGSRAKYRYGAAIITGKACSGVLKVGKFECTDDQLAMANIIHEEMVQIRKKLGMPMSGTDIEAMAVKWHEHRNQITKDEIVSMPYISTIITNMQIKNNRDWEIVFSLLESAKSRKTKAA